MVLLLIGGALVFIALFAQSGTAATLTGTSASSLYTFHWQSDPSQIDAWASQASSLSGVPANEIKAIMYIESRGNPNAQNPNDPSYGLMALMIPTANEMAGRSDITAQELLDNPQENANFGALYLAWLANRYASSYDFGTWADAYNVGPGAFDSGERSNYGADVTEIRTGQRVFLGPGQLAEALA